MKPRSIALWTALVAMLVVATGGAWHASHTARHHRLALLETEQAHARVRAELDRLRGAAAAAERTLAVRREASARPAPVPPAPPPSPPIPPAARASLPLMGPRGPIVGAGDLPLQPLISDPQLQALRMEADRATLATTYGVFFTARGFDATQRKRFIEAVVEHNAGLHDVELIRNTQNLSYDDPALANSRNKLAAELSATQGMLLGEEGVAALQAYDSTLSLRKWVNSLAGTLALSDSPLTPAQGEALVQALAAAQPSRHQVGVAQMGAAGWTALAAAAPAILTPAQLPILHADIEGGAMGRLGGRILALLREGFEKQTAAKAAGKN